MMRERYLWSKMNAVILIGEAVHSAGNAVSGSRLRCAPARFSQVQSNLKFLFLWLKLPSAGFFFRFLEYLDNNATDITAVVSFPVTSTMGVAILSFMADFAVDTKCRLSTEVSDLFHKFFRGGT